MKGSEALPGVRVQRTSNRGVLRDRGDLGPRRIGRIAGPAVTHCGALKVPVIWLPENNRSEPELVAVQRLQQVSSED